MPGGIVIQFLQCEREQGRNMKICQRQAHQSRNVPVVLGQGVVEVPAKAIVLELKTFKTDTTYSATHVV